MAKRQTTRTVHPQKVPITKAVHSGGDGTWRDIVEEALEGVALCLILVLLAMLISKTGPGEQFALFSYRVLQGQLRALPAKVTVIDIGEIRPEITGDPTPRPKLKMLLKAIAANGPAVIGIDIDFSPNVVDGKPAGYMAHDDPSFFEFCKKLGPRVFLGISRTQLLPPDEWLGDPEKGYQSLAAALWVPYDTRRIASSLAPSDTLAAQKLSARTLSSALSSVMIQKESETTWLGRLLERILPPSSRTPLGSNAELDEVLVDYSLLQEDRLPRIAIHPGALQNQQTIDEVIGVNPELIRGRMVLIGDITDASDVFSNPADGKPIAGVLVHALAAQTLATRPLYTFPEWTRYRLDFTLALSIFGAWMLIKHWNHIRNDEGRLLSLMIAVGAIAVIALAMFVNQTRILWDDFLFVALGLAIHPISHRTMHRCKHQLRTMWGAYIGAKHEN